MRHFLLSLSDIFVLQRAGPLIRRLARGLDTLGIKVAKYDYVEKFVRSVRCVPTTTAYPVMEKATFVAPNSTVVGDVTLGKDASVWYGAVIRGDLNKIEIGDRSVIQDRVVIKKQGADSSPIQIGRDVIVAPNSKLGCCTLQDFSYVSMSCTVEDNCVLESYSMLAAGSHLAKGTRLPSGQIWAGAPAKYLRDVTAEERETIHEHLSELQNLASVHAEEAEKSFEQIFTDDAERENSLFKPHETEMNEWMQKVGMPEHPIDQGEGELVNAWEYYNICEKDATDLPKDESWKPFTEDGAVFPESWKVYGEDMDRYERAKKVFEKPTPRRPAPQVVAKMPRDKSPWTKRY